MNTLFQSSMKRSLKRGSSVLTPCFGSAPSIGFVPGPPRSKWISVHGPQGPVSPISQKFALRPKRSTRLGSTPAFWIQMRSASTSAGSPSFSSPPNTVTQRRSFGSPHTSVRSVHAHVIASSLK